MIHTPYNLIVTSDDFPLGGCSSNQCDELVTKLGFGNHRYGGNYYHGHNVVIPRWKIAKSINAQIILNNLRKITGN